MRRLKGAGAGAGSERERERERVRGRGRRERGKGDMTRSRQGRNGGLLTSKEFTWVALVHCHPKPLVFLWQIADIRAPSAHLPAAATPQPQPRRRAVGMCDGELPTRETVGGRRCWGPRGQAAKRQNQQSPHEGPTNPCPCPCGEWGTGPRIVGSGFPPWRARRKHRFPPLSSRKW